MKGVAGLQAGGRLIWGHMTGQAECIKWHPKKDGLQMSFALFNFIYFALSLHHCEGWDISDEDLLELEINLCASQLKHAVQMIGHTIHMFQIYFTCKKGAMYIED